MLPSDSGVLKTHPRARVLSKLLVLAAGLEPAPDWLRKGV